MRRWIVYLLAFAAALLLMPSGQTDVGKLQPVELLYIYKENGAVSVRTDTGDLGRGSTLGEAMADLKATAPGEVFLETAAYVVVTEQTRDLLPQLAAYVRPAAKLLLAKGDIDVENAAVYLAVHDPAVTLKDYRAGERRLPELTMTEGRFDLGQ